MRRMIRCIGVCVLPLLLPESPFAGGTFPDYTGFGGPAPGRVGSSGRAPGEGSLSGLGVPWGRRRGGEEAREAMPAGAESGLLTRSAAPGRMAVVA